MLVIVSMSCDLFSAVPNAPRNFHVVSSKTREVTLKWNKPAFFSGCIQFYTVSQTTQTISDDPNFSRLVKLLILIYKISRIVS